VNRDLSPTLLVRAWLENDDRLRARLTSARDRIGEEFDEDLTFAVASTRGQVIGAVQNWLDDVVPGKFP
jgi:hypothetical protein